MSGRERCPQRSAKQALRLCRNPTWLIIIKTYTVGAGAHDRPPRHRRGLSTNHITYRKPRNTPGASPRPTDHFQQTTSQPRVNPTACPGTSGTTFPTELQINHRTHMLPPHPCAPGACPRHPPPQAHHFFSLFSFLFSLRPPRPTYPQYAPHADNFPVQNLVPASSCGKPSFFSTFL